jgi:sirohydrochlorin ferrochelatase
VPAQLPAPGSPERWAWLQQLRRGPAPLLDPWLAAFAAGAVAPEPDLIAALLERLDADAATRLLLHWLAMPVPDPALAPLLGRVRGEAAAGGLRQALAVASPTRQALLAPLLGHQRCPADFPKLASLALDPHPLAVRRGGLEGLLVGLAAWPAGPLRRTLARLARDHDPALAAQAVDGLARLSGARPELVALARERLDPALQERIERRLRSLPAAPLLLVVHGRAGGVIPAELEQLRAELEQRRGAPVLLQALTAAAAPAAPPPGPAGRPPLTLVPLLLLPGSHVRRDIPAIAAAWRARGPLRRLPFLGAWPAWQQALAAEAAALASPTGPPALLHHPLDGALAARHLALLERRTGLRCLATPYPSATSPVDLPLAAIGSALPLTLAANRLSDALAASAGDAAGRPLLARPRCRAVLLDQLEALP